MRPGVLLGWLLHCAIVTAFSITPERYSRLTQKRDFHGTSRAEVQDIGCINMESVPGNYRYNSDGGQTVCGLYIIGQPDQLIKINFKSFDVSCERTGLLAMVDGWEAQGQFFPSDMDSEIPMDDRYQTFCGDNKPLSAFVSSQNVALLQFRVPTLGDGFTVTIDFLPNKRPCNVVTMMESGALTLRNYGKRRNCSVSILSPQRFDIISMDIGQTTEFPLQTKETGINIQCQKLGRQDYIELLDGDGLDPSYMWRQTELCGLSSNPRDMSFLLGCQHSVVRLVSSGLYYNSVTIQHKPLSDLELAQLSDLEC